MKKMLFTGVIAGIVLFIVSYCSLYLAIKFFPGFFADYVNPLFSSDERRYILFYAHAFVIALALSWFWERFKGLFHGPSLLRGLEFGLVYAVVALLPVMWITFSAMDVTISMVLSWFLYGLIQAMIAGVIFAKINP